MVLFNISIAFLLFSCQSKVDVNIETYKVTRGEFLSSVTETGELAAINSQLISAPNIDWRFGQLKVVITLQYNKVEYLPFESDLRSCFV